VGPWCAVEFVGAHHMPDATFSNGIPNPLLPENHPATSDVCLVRPRHDPVDFDR